MAIGDTEFVDFNFGKLLAVRFGGGCCYMHI